MTHFPTILTAKQIIERELIPCTEDMLKRVARQHHIGRKLGRAYIFTPEDIQSLLESLPCPSSLSEDTAHHSGIYAGPSGESALTKALAFKSKKPLNKSASKGRRNSSKGQSTVIPLHAPSRKPL